MKALWGSVFCLALVSCSRASEVTGQDVRVEFGVFYGGQIQSINRIPFELAPGRQRHGFRVHLSGEGAQARKLSWEVDTPGSSKLVRDRAGRRGRGRVTSVGSAVVEPGSGVVEQTFEFKPGDPLGVYNFRLLVDDELVLDRSVLVFDPETS